MDFKSISLENLAAVVSEKFKEHGIDSVLVGGGCVSIYTSNRYESCDLDFVTYADLEAVEMALLEINFSKKGKYYRHPDCKYYIEFVAPPVAIGRESIEDFEHYHTILGSIKMLTPMDSVKDRLASFYHWGDNASLFQAIEICIAQPSKIDIEELRVWSEKESMLTKFIIFKNEWVARSGQAPGEPKSD